MVVASLRRNVLKLKDFCAAPEALMRPGAKIMDLLEKDFLYIREIGP